jgi:hypothetical protein
VAHITLETTMFPLVVIDLNGAYDEQQAENFCIDMRQLLERREPIAIVADGTHAEMTSLRVRSVMSRFVGEIKPLSDQYTIASALILPNPLIRGAIAAMFHLKKPKNPMKVFKLREDAMSWVKHRLVLSNNA